MTDDDDFLIDDLYEGGIELPHNPDDLIFTELQRGWESVHWTEIEATGDVLDALVGAVTQFHYIHLSQVLLLGSILEQEEDMRAKRLAIILAAARMRKVDTWGRYLGQAQSTDTVSPELQDHFNDLYADKQVISRLLGVLLADVYLFAVGTVLDDIGDPLFGRLIRRDMRQAEQNLEIAEEYFRDTLPELDAGEREAILDKIERYQTRFEEIVLGHADSFDALAETEAELMATARQEIETFYDRIGIDNERIQ